MDWADTVCGLDLHAPFLPALPWISQFPETNVRTYVRGPDGEPGIWFFTLEAARMIAVLGARMLYGLPYHSSEMQVTMQRDSIEYRSHRETGKRLADSRISILIGEPAPGGEMETFLTARFRLYSTLRGQLSYADVEHDPWTLNVARARSLEQTLIESVGLPSPRGEPFVHYSHGVRTRIGRLHEAR